MKRLALALMVVAVLVPTASYGFDVTSSGVVSAIGPSAGASSRAEDYGTAHSATEATATTPEHRSGAGPNTVAQAQHTAGLGEPRERRNGEGGGGPAPEHRSGAQRAGNSAAGGASASELRPIASGLPNIPLVPDYWGDSMSSFGR